MDSDFIDLGISKKPFAMPKPPDDVVVIGAESGEERWTRVITRRAAHALWYHLTTILYPGRERHITTRAATAPIRSEESPSVTTFVEVFRGEDDFIEMLGTGGKSEWLARFSEREARALWAVLDKMLFPLGWEGSQYRMGNPPDS